MPSPIDTKKFQDLGDIEKNDNQIAYIGRDSYEKGIDILRQIEPKIKGNVVYCTSLPWREAMRVLKSSSLIVIPSRMESLPTVVKEAFYLKIPVIATSVGGMPELVVDKNTGILVPPENPDKLLEEINHLLQNKEYCKKLTDAAYNFVINNMTWDVILPNYVNFYKSLLKS